MKVGFTGTREGLDTEQERDLRLLLTTFPPEAFHHGSCRGADVEAARIVRECCPKCWIVSHPGPDDDPNRDESGVDNEVRDGKTHFARNRDIVNEVDEMVAAPLYNKRQTRGGTWYTVDYAEKNKRVVVMLYRAGPLTE